MDNGCRVGIFTRVFRYDSYVGRAVESILNQTYSNFKYYVLVNEITEAAIQRYAEMDQRIEIINTIDGLDGFRTYSKQIASDGNAYVATLDADDWYEKTWLEKMLGFVTENELDIAACGSYFVTEKGNIAGSRAIQEDLIVNRTEFPRYLPLYYMFCRTIWGKLYASKAVLKSKTESIPPSSQYGGYGGDTLDVFTILDQAESFGVKAENLHYYQISSISGSHSLLEGRLKSDVLLFHFIEGFLKQFGEISEKNLMFLYTVYGNALVDTILLLTRSKLSEYERITQIGILLNESLTKQLIKRSQINQLFYNKTESRFEVRLAEIIFDAHDIHQKSTELLTLYYKAFCCLFPDQIQIYSFQKFCLLLRKRKFMHSFLQMDYIGLFKELLLYFPNFNSQDSELCISALKEIAPNSVLKFVLLDRSFVLSNRKLILKIVDGKYQEAIQDCLKARDSEIILKYQNHFIDLIINLSAYAQDAEHFIEGKMLKYNFLKQNGHSSESEIILKELVEMGIDDAILLV